MEDTKSSEVLRVGRHIVVAALATAATFGAASAGAADMFLKIGDIKGESTDAKHRDEVDVLAWSWGVNGPVAGDSKKTSVPACSEPLLVEKRVDLATPQLATGAALNTSYPTATLVVRRPGAKQPIDAVVLSLKGVTVKSLVNGGDADGEMKEQLKLGYASATFTYTSQKADGSAGASVSGNVPASCP